MKRLNMKANCFGCKARDEDICSLGFIFKYEIGVYGFNYSMPIPKPIQICPKPRTNKKLYQLLDKE